MADKKYTNRIFFQNIIAGKISDAEIEHARAMLAKLDETNAKRANTPTKKDKENEPIKEAILSYVGNATAPVIATDVAAKLSISTQKASALLVLLKNEGKLANGEPDKKKHVTYVFVDREIDNVRPEVLEP